MSKLIPLTRGQCAIVDDHRVRQVAEARVDEVPF